MSESKELVNVKSDQVKRFNTQFVQGIAQIFLTTGLQFIPIVGSPAANAISGSLDLLWKNRLNVLLDELDQKMGDLSEEAIRSHELPHAVQEVYRATLHTRHEEKIHLLAGLLANYAKSDMKSQADEFDNALKILDDLTFHEFQILALLREYELKTVLPYTMSDEVAEYWRARKYWSEFRKAIHEQIHIPENQITGCLERLKRTGLYQTTGVITGLDPGSEGYLTANFYAFIKALGLTVDTTNHETKRPNVYHTFEFDEHVVEVCWSVAIPYGEDEDLSLKRFFVVIDGVHDPEYDDTISISGERISQSLTEEEIDRNIRDLEFLLKREMLARKQ